MKKIKYIVLILLSFLLITNKVDAKVLTEEEFVEINNIERAYILGNHVFDLSNGYNPSLKDLMIAASYTKKADIKVYEVKVTTNINNEVVKEYNELLSNTELNSFPVIDVKYVYDKSIGEDNYKADLDEAKELKYGKTNGKLLTKDEYDALGIERAYVIGEYMFNLDDGFNPSLEDLLIAATSTFTSDIKVYEIKKSENIDGDIIEEYYELLSNKKLDEFPEIYVKWIYSKNVNGNNPDTTLPYYDVITLPDVTKTYTASPIVVTEAVSENNLPINYEFYPNVDCTGDKLNLGAVNVGEYGVKAISVGTQQYLSGEACAKLTVVPLDASDATVTLNNPTVIYTGSALTPEFTVKKNNITLQNNTDYIYEFSNNIHAGTSAGVLTITYKGNYTGSTVFNFTISKKAITLVSDNHTMTYDGAYYESTEVSFCKVKSGFSLGTGDAITACSVKAQGKVVGTHNLAIQSYTISKGEENVNSDYNVTLEVGTITINKRETTCTLSPLNKEYDGTPFTPTTVCSNLVTGHTVYNNKAIPTLTNVADTTTYTMQKTNITLKEGSTDVTSNYNITIASNGEIPLAILAKDGSVDPHIIVSKEYNEVAYDGTQKKPAVTGVYDEALNKHLVAGQDYDVTYFNNINVGEGEIRINFKNNYTGVKKITFYIH